MKPIFEKLLAITFEGFKTRMNNHVTESKSTNAQISY